MRGKSKFVIKVSSKKRLWIHYNDKIGLIFLIAIWSSGRLMEMWKIIRSNIDNRSLELNEKKSAVGFKYKVIVPAFFTINTSLPLKVKNSSNQNTISGFGDWTSLRLKKQLIYVTIKTEFPERAELKPT